MKNVALAYRILAWVVGINLILVMIGFVGQKTTDELSWFNQNDGLVTAIDVAHGWMFMALLVLIAILAKNLKWTVGFTLSTMILATIPIASFWVERRASRAIAESEAAGAPRG